MTEQNQADLYIVGIGASAGGLEALERFFTKTPLHKNVAYVIIQHLSPDYESHMVHLLSKYTPLTVCEAEDGMLVEPNSIYLIPRRKNMTIFGKRLYLIDYKRQHGLNLPIDIFFESLAKDKGEQAIAIVLSGTGSDGTRGIRAIKEAGGMVMVQDDSARFDGMPRSAISTNIVDYVLSPEEMPPSLLSYIEHPRIIKDSGRTASIAKNETQMGKLFAVLRDTTGVDFTYYKPGTIARCIERRMSVNLIEDLQDYVSFLQESKSECRSLYKEFLISVTRFFRDPEAFEYLEHHILPELCSTKTRQDQLRVWVPGCATGEEVYSLAILLAEYMEKSAIHLNTKIFATDIDKEALQFASRGVYPESIVADISSERLSKFFVKKEDTYEILRHVRSMVVFAHHNIIKDPPFSKMDFISCRNLLIYLQPQLQKKVIGTFQFALNPEAFLVLGTSESIGEFAHSFRSKHDKWKVYQVYSKDRIPLEQISVVDTDERRRDIGITAYHQLKKTDDWRSSDPVLRSLVEQVMPPCVVVDENYKLVHAFGEIDKYLSPPVGFRLDLNVLKMARKDLSLAISAALHRSKHEKEDVVYRDVKLEEDGQTTLVHLTTRPFFEKSSHQRLFLLTFTSETRKSEAQAEGETFNLTEGTAQRITNLEQELQYAKQSLQATIEELETANEELQASNEELRAANEELQSTNEELHSVNEELLTVNAEYQVKIKELTDLNNDVNNLLKGTDVGTIFLDAELKLRKFTPPIQTEVNLLEQDVGRPFEHISYNLVNVDLLQLAQQVLDTQVKIEQEVQSKSARWYQLKVLPYYTHVNQVDGVVVTLIDITAQKHAQMMLRENEERFHVALKGSPIMVSEQDSQFRYIWVHNLHPGFASDDIVGKTDGEVLPSSASQTLIDLKQSILETGERVSQEITMPINGQDFYFEFTGEPLKEPFHNEDTQSTRVLCSLLDLTKLKKAQQEAVVNQTLLQSIPAFFIALDSEGKVLRMNDHLLNTLGYTEAEVLGCEYLKMFVPENEHPIVHEAVTNARAGNGNSDATNHLLKKNGERIYVEWNGRPLLNGTGELNYFIALGRISSE